MLALFLLTCALVVLYALSGLRDGGGDSNHWKH